jgi:putative spermidine/putrescine transport system ATP-binding protein
MHGEGVAVTAEGVRLIGTPMEGFNTKSVSVAIRPEDLEVADSHADNTFDAQVETVEYGGRDSLVIVTTSFGNLWARLPGEFTPGDRITLRTAPARTLVYGGEAA